MHCSKSRRHLQLLIELYYNVTTYYQTPFIVPNYDQAHWKLLSRTSVMVWRKQRDVRTLRDQNLLPVGGWCWCAGWRPPIKVLLPPLVWTMLNSAWDSARDFPCCPHQTEARSAENNLRPEQWIQIQHTSRVQIVHVKVVTQPERIHQANTWPDF